MVVVVGGRRGLLRGACGCGGGRTVGRKRLFESDVGGGVVVGGWSQNNNSKRKTAISKSRSPMNHE